MSEKIHFINLFTGGSPLTILDMEGSVNLIHDHRESSMLAIALEDFSIMLIDIDTHRLVRKFIGHTGQITDASFSPDSRWLVTSSMDCSIRTWDIPSGQLVDQFGIDQACISLSFSPTGEALATVHVDSLGIFLWLNKTLYAKITLKALTPSENPPSVMLPEFSQIISTEEETLNDDEDVYLSPEQISKNLITLSGLSTSRWQNLLEIDIIKKRNKPKMPPRKPKAAPFFLPTISSLNDIQFNLTMESDEGSKILKPITLINITEFGKILKSTKDTNDFQLVIEKLKSFGPSMLDFEIKSLSPDNGGSLEIMLQFFKCIEFMLKSNKNFELAEAYMAVFLKVHGVMVAQEETLRNYLANIRSCHTVAWQRLQNSFLYIQCILQHSKTS